MKYAIIRVRHGQDEIDNLQCMGLSPTEDDAYTKVIQLQKEQDDTWTAFTKYVDKWVLENVKLPENTDDYNVWKKFLSDELSKLFGHQSGSNIYIKPQEYIGEYKKRLFRGHGLKLAGYDPPAVCRMSESYFIVDITESVPSTLV
jgi:hypothetical protein